MLKSVFSIAGLGMLTSSLDKDARKVSIILRRYPSKNDNIRTYNASAQKAYNKIIWIIDFINII